MCVSEHISGTTRPIFINFFSMLHMAVARSSGGVVICYMLPVLWMTSYLHIIGHMKPVDAIAESDVIASSRAD